MVGVIKSHSFSSSWVFLMLCIFSMIHSSKGEHVYKESHEERLHKALMEHYVKTAHPARDKTGFKVDLNIGQPRLETLETATDTMTFSYSLMMRWQDDRLQWNATDFGNLIEIRLSADSIWLPEMEVFNVSPFHPSQTRVPNAIVSSSGSVMFSPVKTVSFFCPLDLTQFPYDTQTCKLIMGPWTYSSKEENLTYNGKTEPQDIPLGGYSASGHPQWTLNKITIRRNRYMYECCPNAYLDFSVYISVSRIAPFYRLVLVGPSIFLAILIPVAFLLPSDQTCRTTYGMVLLMTMTVLMVVLQEAVPFDHATVPVLAVFYFAIFVLQFFSILCCTLTGYLKSMGTRRKALPSWLCFLCIRSQYVRQCLFLDTNFPVYHESDTAMNIRLMEAQHGMAQDSVQGNVAPSSSDDHSREVPNNTKVDITVPDEHLREVANNTKVMARKIIRDSTYEKLQRDWEEVGRCLDRIFFVMFIMLTAIVALSTVL